MELRNCLRQAEMGVGDCAGLQNIPGATKNGRQKPPAFVMKMLNLSDADFDGSVDDDDAASSSDAEPMGLE